MKFCPECGTKFEIRDPKFCPECGYNLVATMVKPEPTPQPESGELAEEVPDSPAYESQTEEPVAEVTEEPVVEVTEEPVVEVTEEPVVEVTEETEVEQTVSDMIGEIPTDVIDLPLEENELELSEKSDDIDDSDGVPCFEIVPEYTKEQFIREAWIRVALDNVPVEVFNCDFGEVKVVDHQVYEENIEVTLNYRASIGYDRQEPYLDYETYYEEEPYQTTEKQWDSAIGAYRTYQVTKYKRVQKQRQVTKYKTVTDWSSYKGSVNATSFDFTENIPGVDLNKRVYLDSVNSMDESKIKPTGQKAVIRESVIKEIQKEQNRKFEHEVLTALPGDHSRDAYYNVANVLQQNRSVINLKEYRATLSFNGKKYTRFAYPFGQLNVVGDIVENDKSPETFEKEQKNIVKKKNEDDISGIDTRLWRRSKWLSILSMVLLCASAIISCFLRYPVPVIISFAVAIIVFILCKVYVKKEKTALEYEVNSHIEAREKKLKDEILNYTKNYEKIMLTALNGKMKKLGMSLVSEKEFYEGVEDEV